ncbi:LysR family transcriptional regulator [Loktanella sp. DJP18]|uniref:LysR family transcriptional regulator n=1 Tax=Loktanella sp. DJP18 TaxID=3409788 RepID=UPI003BB741D0
MKDDLRLDDLALFLAVIAAGGLQGAVATTGVSAPTLSRRMTALETQTGRLFHRGVTGFALTARGRDLAATAAPLTELQDRIARWVTADSGPLPVRITAGSWTSRFLARHIGQVWQPGAVWTPAFLSANALLDIARRAADIGIRSSRPTQSWLAGRQTGTVRHAAFARDSDVQGYIALPSGAPSTPAERWLRATHAEEIVTTANHESLALDLARAGIGRLVLPTFAGADNTGLVQVGDPVPELAHEEWLVSHHAARDDPPIRAALTALARLLTAPRPGDGR